MTGGKTLPAEVMEEILARTDGVPLFVEELTKDGAGKRKWCRSGMATTVLERLLPPWAIPTTLQASLMARLDRLAPVREVAQIGAVAGRDFHYELLSAIAQMPQKKSGRGASASWCGRIGVPPGRDLHTRSIRSSTRWFGMPHIPAS